MFFVLETCFRMFVLLYATCKCMFLNLNIVSHHQKARLIEYNALQFVGLSQLSRQTKTTTNAFIYMFMFVNVVLFLIQ